MELFETIGGAFLLLNKSLVANISKLVLFTYFWTNDFAHIQFLEKIIIKDFTKDGYCPSADYKGCRLVEILKSSVESPINLKVVT